MLKETSLKSINIIKALDIYRDSNQIGSTTDLHHASFKNMCMYIIWYIYIYIYIYMSTHYWQQTFNSLSGEVGMGQFCRVLLMWDCGVTSTFPFG